MRLTELFEPRDLVVGFDPSDKWDSISKLVDHLVASGRIAKEAAGEIREAITSRERSMSTGMENGIAIPHAAVDSVKKIVACLGIVGREGGLDYQSIDGRPTRLVVLLVIPKAEKLLHIRTLADVARVFGRDSVRGSLLAAQNADEAWAALREGELEAR